MVPVTVTSSEGFIGQLLKTNAKHVPPPAGVRSPMQCRTVERLRELFGDVMAKMGPDLGDGADCSARPDDVGVDPLAVPEIQHI